jgi:hypothetical protein
LSVKDLDLPALLGEGWDAGRAARFLRSWAGSLARDARYLEENADGAGFSEEEFRLLLEHGLGLDDEEIDSAVDEAQQPSCRICACTQERACAGGCSWAEPDLCSRCVGKTEPEHDGGRMQERIVGAYLALSCNREAARAFIAQDLREGLAAGLLEEDPLARGPIAVRHSPLDGVAYGLGAAIDGRVVLFRLVDGRPITVTVAPEWVAVLDQLGARAGEICPLVIRRPQPDPEETEE